LASQGGREGKKGKRKNIFLTNQTPVNKRWQGYSFANYKSIPFDFHKNYALISVDNFSILREGNNIEPSDC